MSNRQRPSAPLCGPSGIPLPSRFHSRSQLNDLISLLLILSDKFLHDRRSTSEPFAAPRLREVPIDLFGRHEHVNHQPSASAPRR